MRIGFDVDGVLANFIQAYCNLVIQVTGRNLFAVDDWETPPCWNWPEYRGYTKAEMSRVWDAIKASPSFWYSLLPTDNMRTVGMMLYDLEYRHDCYYVTNRMGLNAKRQTEAFLTRYLPYAQTGLMPTVLLAADKGAAAKALNLDVYIDDNLDNIKSVLRESAKTRAYLLDCAYNQGAVEVKIPTGYEIAPGVPAYTFETRTGIRVPTVGDMFDAEIANL